MVQFAPAVSTDGQLFVWANSAQSCTPPIAMLSMGREPVVVFVIVTGMGVLTEPTATLPKARVVAVVDMPMPKPLRAIVCVPVPSVSVMVIVPGTGPATVGLKLMLMVQVPAGAMVVTQLLLCWNGPVGTSLFTVMAVELLLVNVMGTAALRVPTT